jgi:hypothetical protein
LALLAQAEGELLFSPPCQQGNTASRPGGAASRGFDHYPASPFAASPPAACHLLDSPRRPLQSPQQQQQPPQQPLFAPPNGRLGNGGGGAGSAQLNRHPSQPLAGLLAGLGSQEGVDGFNGGAGGAEGAGQGPQQGHQQQGLTAQALIAQAEAALAAAPAAQPATGGVRMAAVKLEQADEQQELQGQQGQEAQTLDLQLLELLVRGGAGRVPPGPAAAGAGGMADEGGEAPGDAELEAATDLLIAQLLSSATAGALPAGAEPEAACVGRLSPESVAQPGCRGRCS